MASPRSTPLAAFATAPCRPRCGVAVLGLATPRSSASSRVDSRDRETTPDFGQRLLVDGAAAFTCGGTAGKLVIHRPWRTPGADGADIQGEWTGEVRTPPRRAGSSPAVSSVGADYGTAADSKSRLFPDGRVGSSNARGQMMRRAHAAGAPCFTPSTASSAMGSARVSESGGSSSSASGADDGRARRAPSTGSACVSAHHRSWPSDGNFGSTTSSTIHRPSQHSSTCGAGLHPSVSAAAIPSVAQAMEFTVTLEKKGRKFGIVAVHNLEEEFVTIKNIADGLFSAWNAAHPRKQVLEKDRIVAVNGKRGSSRLLMDMLAQSEVVELLIVRGDEAPKPKYVLPPPVLRTSTVVASAMVPPRRPRSSLPAKHSQDERISGNLILASSAWEESDVPTRVSGGTAANLAVAAPAAASPPFAAEDDLDEMAAALLGSALQRCGATVPAAPAGAPRPAVPSPAQSRRDQSRQALPAPPASTATLPSAGAETDLRSLSTSAGTKPCRSRSGSLAPELVALVLDAESEAEMQFLSGQCGGTSGASVVPSAARRSRFDWPIDPCATSAAKDTSRVTCDHLLGTTFGSEAKRVATAPSGAADDADTASGGRRPCSYGLSRAPTPRRKLDSDALHTQRPARSDYSPREYVSVAAQIYRRGAASAVACGGDIASNAKRSAARFGSPIRDTTDATALASSASSAGAGVFGQNLGTDDVDGVRSSASNRRVPKMSLVECVAAAVAEVEESDDALASMLGFTCTAKHTKRDDPVKPGGQLVRDAIETSISVSTTDRASSAMSEPSLPPPSASQGSAKSGASYPGPTKPASEDLQAAPDTRSEATAEPSPLRLDELRALASSSEEAKGGNTNPLVTSAPTSARSFLQPEGEPCGEKVRDAGAERSLRGSRCSSLCSSNPPTPPRSPSGDTSAPLRRDSTIASTAGSAVAHRWTAAETDCTHDEAQDDQMREESTAAENGNLDSSLREMEVAVARADAALWAEHPIREADAERAAMPSHNRQAMRADAAASPRASNHDASRAASPRSVLPWSPLQVAPQRPPSPAGSMRSQRSVRSARSARSARSVRSSRSAASTCSTRRAVSSAAPTTAAGTPRGMQPAPSEEIGKFVKRSAHEGVGSESGAVSDASESHRYLQIQEFGEHVPSRAASVFPSPLASVCSVPPTPHDRRTSSVGAVAAAWAGHRPVGQSSGPRRASAASAVAAGSVGAHARRFSTPGSSPMVPRLPLESQHGGAVSAHGGSDYSNFEDEGEMVSESYGGEGRRHSVSSSSRAPGRKVRRSTSHLEERQSYGHDACTQPRAADSRRRSTQLPPSLVDCALCGREACCDPDSTFCKECSARLDVLGPQSPPQPVSPMNSVGPSASKTKSRTGGRPLGGQKHPGQLRRRGSKQDSASSWGSSSEGESADSTLRTLSSPSPLPTAGADQPSCIRCMSRFIRAPGARGSVLCPRCTG